MHTFFSRNITPPEIRLDAAESSHAIRVLRLTTGDTIQILDGAGNIYTGRITEDPPRGVVLRIINHKHLIRRAPYYLHIAIAPPKNMNRFEFFLEKAVETGIDEVTPLLCARSERDRIRMERLEKITVSALKQSGQPFLPRLNPMSSFSSFVQQPFDGDKLIAHCCTHERATRYLADAISARRILLMIGPEGDFTQEELELAFTHRFTAVSLGHSRLRTETAGIAGTVITASRFFHTKD